MAELASMSKYEAYKDSGEGWISKVPEHWEVKKLKHIFFEKKHTQNMNLNCGSISFGKVVTKDDDKIPHSTKASYQEVLRGEFLINPLNLNYDLISLRIGLSEIDVVVSAGYIVLKNKVNMSKEYFKYLLHRYDVAYMKLLGSGVRQTINFNHIANSLLLMPPMLEQTAIASFLDKKTAQIDDAIAIKEKQIELLKERKQIIIQQAVTQGISYEGKPNTPMKDSGVDWIGKIPEHWEVKKIKYLTKIFRGKFTHRPRNDPALYDGQYPFFQTGDVARANKFLYEFKQTLNEKGLKVSTLIPKGTVVITIAANIGDVAILDLDACFPDSVVGFSPYKEMDRDFLYYALGNMKQQFMDSSIKNTQMNLNVDRIGSNSLCQPPIEEQVKIVEVIENKSKAIDDAVELQKQQIEKLKEYKTTLINSAVTGKIKVPGVV